MVVGVGLVVEEGATMPFGGTSAFFHSKASPPPGIAWALTSMGGQDAITAGAVGEGDGEVVWSWRSGLRIAVPFVSARMLAPGTTMHVRGLNSDCVVPTLAAMR